MPCGCSKGRSAGTLPTNRLETASPRRSARVAVYEVVTDGLVKLSTTSPAAARQEAKRLGGSVRVTSRPVDPGEPQELAG
jgi:hypothetical protein